MNNGYIIVHMSTVHSHDDIRIFHKECCSLVKAGYEVHFVVPDAPNIKSHGVFLHGVPKSGSCRLIRMTKTVYFVYQAARAIEADLYHFHDPELLPVGLILKLCGERVIFDAHEDLPRQLMSKPWLPSCIRKPISWLVERFENAITRKLDAVITATPHIEARFKKAGCHAIAINNYAKLDEFCIVESSWMVKQNAVCYVGGITIIRGVKEMVVAIGLTNTKLYVAGSFESSKLRDETTSLPGWKSVEECGQVDRKAIVDLLLHSCAGLVVFHPVPNHVDAQPNKIFEYMAAGIPVIASDFPLWKEIVEGNSCGICVDPLKPEQIAEAIRWIADHPVEARQMGENGRHAVEEEYNWERESKKLILLYESLLRQ